MDILQLCFLFDLDQVVLGVHVVDRSTENYLENRYSIFQIIHIKIANVRTRILQTFMKIKVHILKEM